MEFTDYRSHVFDVMSSPRQRFDFGGIRHLVNAIAKDLR